MQLAEELETDGGSSALGQFARRKLQSYLVLDTDFLIKISNDPVKRLDLGKLAAEFTLTTTSGVIRELKGLEKSRDRKTSRRAANALRILEGNASKAKIRVLGSDEESTHTMNENKKDGEKSNFTDVDADMVELARKKGKNVVIATMDHSLLSRLERMGLPYLTLSEDRPIMRK